jgi:hypothetical protein
LKFQAEVFGDIQSSGSTNQDVSKIGIDSPVSFFVRIGQGTPRRFATKSSVIEFGLHGPQADFDISETFAVRQLRKGHAKELVVA